MDLSNSGFAIQNYIICINVYHLKFFENGEENP